MSTKYCERSSGRAWLHIASTTQATLNARFLPSTSIIEEVADFSFITMAKCTLLLHMKVYLISSNESELKQAWHGVKGVLGSFHQAVLNIQFWSPAMLKFVMINSHIFDSRIVVAFDKCVWLQLATTNLNQPHNLTFRDDDRIASTFIASTITRFENHMLFNGKMWW